MNQTTPSLRWLNSKPKYMNQKMNSHPHTMTLESGVLNVYIIVCSGFVVHRLMKCISLQSLNHHIGRNQSLLILTVCAWIRKGYFYPLWKGYFYPLCVNKSSLCKEYIPCGLFFSLNKFSFMKNPNYDHTSH